MSNRKCTDTLGSTLTSLVNAFTKLGDEFCQLERSLREEGVPSEVELPTTDVGAFRFALMLQSNSLFSKFEPLQGPGTRERAVTKWYDAEKQCAETAARFCHLKEGHPGDDWFMQRLVRARAICHSILGEVDLNEMILKCDFGPGANIGHPRHRGHAVEKIAGKATVTGTCLPYLHAFLEFDWTLYCTVGPDCVVEGNEAFTVPKNYKADRFCAKEPLWNMFFQKGFGAMIRSRLRRVGLDLNRQQMLNRDLALAGSVHGLLATEDLKSASDTLCTALVRYLLPDDWFFHLNNVRSHKTLLDGKYITVRKMASMGNGFAFELESLVFLALTLAACDLPLSSIGRHVSVYGDDIICPSVCVEDLRKLFSFCGLTSNPDKSFHRGFFRESCGGQFYAGRDVTPFYIKTVPTGLDRLYVLANQIARWASRLACGWGRDDRVKGVYDEVLSRIPPSRRLPIPDGVGDGGLVTDWDVAAPAIKRACKHRRFRGWEGYLVPQYCAISPETALLRQSKYGWAALVHKLWTVRQGRTFDLGFRGPLRDGSEEPPTVARGLDKPSGRPRWATVLTVVKQWESLGPWVTVTKTAETDP